jgi:hypothetical protein
VSALLQLAVLSFAIPETLEQRNVRPFSLASLNPFRFLSIVRAPRTLQTLAATLFFNFFAEGKNIISLIQVWMVGSPLHWPVGVQARQSVVYGIFMFVSGKVVAPKLIRSLGESSILRKICSIANTSPDRATCGTASSLYMSAESILCLNYLVVLHRCFRWLSIIAAGQRGFTTASNICNAVGTGMMGLSLPSFGVSFWLGHVVQLPGINNTSAAAVKAMAIDHAVAAGFGRGEWGGMYSSLRTFSMIVAPLIYSSAYTLRERSGFGWLSPWFVVAILGAVVPECLHRTLSDKALQVPA